MDVHIPKQLNNGTNGQHKNLQTGPSNGGPTMKGNIGPTRANVIDKNAVSKNQKDLFSRMAEEFDIDNVIPERKEQASHQIESSMHSFDLSIKNEELDM